MERIEPTEYTEEILRWFKRGIVPRREVTREEMEREYPSKPESK